MDESLSKIINEMKMKALADDEFDNIFEQNTDKQKKESYIYGTMLGLCDSLNREQYFLAIEQIGALCALGYKDVDYFRGVIKAKMGDYKGAITDLKKVPNTSAFYNTASNVLLNSYVTIGDYSELNRCLSASASTYSTIKNMELKLTCLQNLVLANHSIPETVEIETIQEVNEVGTSKEDWHSFFVVCTIFGNLLTAAGECINQCTNYYKKTQNEINISNPDVSKYVILYDRIAKLLPFSSLLQPITIASEEGHRLSLADIALVNEDWERKIDIFRNTNYVSQFMRVLYCLENPNLHKYERKYDVIKAFLDQIITISPREVSHILSLYFQEVSEEALHGDDSALQYMCFAYSDILASDEDPYKLKDKLENYLTSNEVADFSKITEQRKRVNNLSYKALEAFSVAESMFKKIDGSKYGAKDASAFALMYFRILEIEYNEKFIKRFIKVIDISLLNSLCGGSKRYQECSENQKANRKKWEKDVKMLNQLITGKRMSLEIGTIRTLLEKVNRNKDSVAYELYQNIQKILTQKGQQAFNSEDMMELIGKVNVSEYRNPGAHTGYIPYSKACEGRKLVIENVGKINEWFKEAP